MWTSGVGEGLKNSSVRTRVQKGLSGPFTGIFLLISKSVMSTVSVGTLGTTANNHADAYMKYYSVFFRIFVHIFKYDIMAYSKC